MNFIWMLIVNASTPSFKASDQMNMNDSKHSINEKAGLIPDEKVKITVDQTFNNTNPPKSSTSTLMSRSEGLKKEYDMVIKKFENGLEEVRKHNKWGDDLNALLSFKCYQNIIQCSKKKEAGLISNKNNSTSQVSMFYTLEIAYLNKSLKDIFL